MAEKEIAIRVDHVSKDFSLPHEKVTTVKGLFTGATKRHMQKDMETQHALKDISFEVNQGEFFGIVGRNGSGKSTLLKILAKIYQPTEGSVMTNGKLVPFIELGVGFNPELTGRENVYLNGAMLGFSQKEIDRMYDGIVAFAELERFMDQKLKNYSSGMQVRLAFSMATRSNADILLVDEVLAVGDADFQRKCFSYFKKLKRDKKTVVFVSHDMNAIREYCDQAVLIENNEILIRGDTQKVATMYTKLFNVSEADKEAGAPKKRWGNKEIVIRKRKAVVNEATDKVVVSMEVEANAHCEHPIYGFSIKNESGLVITGTNSKLLLEDTGVLNAKDRRKITFEVENMFRDGTYLVDVTATSDDGVTVYDWWEDATKVKVYKEMLSPYVTQPKMWCEHKTVSHDE